MDTFLEEGWRWNYDRLHSLPNLKEYIEHGTPLGGFLSAVVSNDLMAACGRADDFNLVRIPAYAAWLYNHAPIGSYGSPAAYKAWVKRGGLAGFDLGCLNDGPNERRDEALRICGGLGHEKTDKGPEGNRSGLHVVRCEVCNYRYTYDTSD